MKKRSSDIGFFEGLMMMVGVLFGSAIIFGIVYISDMHDKKMKVTLSDHARDCRKAYIIHKDFDNCVLPDSYRPRY